MQTGVFATRLPQRSNQIGLSAVKLRKIERKALFMNNINYLYGTQLLDIVARGSMFDEHSSTSTDLLDSVENKVEDIKSYHHLMAD